MTYSLPSKGKAIALTGFMGAGKTTVGRAIAKKTNALFIDLDEAVERASSMTIAEIFREKGEPYFRLLEREVLATLRQEKLIIALGGGTFTDDETIDLIHDFAVSVWLDCPVEICFDRCEKSDVERPLLTDFDSFSKLYERRLTSYRRAKHHFSTFKKSSVDLAEAIMSMLKAFA